MKKIKFKKLRVSLSLFLLTGIVVGVSTPLIVNHEKHVSSLNISKSAHYLQFNKKEMASNELFKFSGNNSIKNIINKLPNEKSKKLFIEGFEKYEKINSDEKFSYLKNLAKNNNVNLDKELKFYKSLSEKGLDIQNNNLTEKYDFNQNLIEESNFSVNDYLNKLWNFYKVSSAMAGVAGGVAAGYYLAAAFDFGTTIPSGAAATAQSIGLGVQAGIIKNEIDTIVSNAKSFGIDQSLALNKYNEWLNDHRNDAKDMIEFINKLRESIQKIKKVMTIVVVLVNSTIWAVPEGAAVEDVANDILETSFDTYLSIISSEADQIVNNTLSSITN